MKRDIMPSMGERNPFDAEKPVKPQRERDVLQRVSKTVLHAAERGRKNLFLKLTAENAEKLTELMEKQPVFYAEKAEAPRVLLLDEVIEDALPPAFFENPTRWIEERPNIGRSDVSSVELSGTKISELWEQPYDVSRVKAIDLSIPSGETVHLVSKRISSKDMAELAMAKRAFDAGIPTPRVLAEIVDQGNVYAWFERIESINLNELFVLDAYRALNFILMIKQGEMDEQIDQHPWISEDGKKRLKELWIAASPDIQMLHAYDILQSILKILCDLVETEDREVAHEYLSTHWKNFERFNTDAGRIGVARELGFSSTVELFHAIFPEHATGDDFHFGNLEALLQKTIEKYDQKQVAVYPGWQQQFRRLAMQDVFGFDPSEEVEHLKQMCAEKGIEHKDFNSRNILVPWDAAGHRPRKLEAGKPALYLIDWEVQKTSSPSDEE